MDELQKSVEELTGKVTQALTEIATLKTVTAEIQALKEAVEALGDDAKAVDTVAEKLLERVEAIEVAVGAPKGEGDEPPARPAQKPKELVANVVRPAEFQRR